MVPIDHFQVGNGIAPHWFYENGSDSMNSCLVERGNGLVGIPSTNVKTDSMGPMQVV